jgi:uncharacterized membrane protein YfcA
MLWLLGVATSALSAVVGMAGGLFLLAALLLYLEPATAIPVHGVAQLVSNGSRLYLQRRYVEWEAIRSFVWLLVPGGLVGLWLLHSIPPDLGRLGIGGFALAAIWLPTGLRWGFGLRLQSNPGAATRRFVAAGAVAGVANMVVGATGPLMAPFVLSLNLERLGTVATLAMCQGLGHLMKVGIFSFAGFPFAEFALGLGGLCVAVVIGSVLGTKLLRRLPERYFAWSIRVAVSAVALRLIWQSLAGPARA